MRSGGRERKRRVKRLIVCCDGTWNSPENTKLAPSNVMRLARAVLPTASDGVTQAVYYDPGVGSGNIVDKLTGGAFGSGLSQNVREAYRFIVLNYEPGDALYFFGFSRGALHRTQHCRLRPQGRHPPEAARGPAQRRLAYLPHPRGQCRHQRRRELP
jgi:uncharacterized protein (DUF2235 family)